jgi:hypothetical protein
MRYLIGLLVLCAACSLPLRASVEAEGKAHIEVTAKDGSEPIWALDAATKVVVGLDGRYVYWERDSHRGGYDLKERKTVSAEEAWRHIFPDRPTPTWAQPDAE